MNLQPSARQRELVALAGDLARTQFAPRAAMYDQNASFPFENYADLRQAGLLALCIPERYGGMGADFATYCLVSEEIARSCGATALTFNMHCSTMMWIGQLADELDMSPAERQAHESRRTRVYQHVLENGHLYAQPFSEGHQSQSGRLIFQCRAKRTEGGFRISGKKIFASLADAAHYFGVLACLDDDGDDDDASSIHYLAVETGAPGVSIEGEWNPLGMRGTVSRDLVMQDCFVPEHAQLLPEGIYHQATRRWPHMFLTLAPTYLGLTQAAYDFAVDYLSGRVPNGPPSGERIAPIKQYAIAELLIHLEAARALLYRAVSEAGLDPSPEALRRAFAANRTVMETATQVTADAIRICGGRSMLKPLPLERYYRDARCGALMQPWTADNCLERIGSSVLPTPKGTMSP
ncbi:MAG: BEC protein [Candidatus Entotheonella factor]|uniref:Dibenzothiophene monooxygenase n=1 Tax=Entotheonella factor TaxID=1429438 RepID=W4LA30_ENTF1|nr:acyl-CoA dehydrogenase family protein [Candidatus Entotheonella palauensis]ETW94560.1 MAG: BEC protein [Candidatus Entotheonella factor]